MVARSGTGVEPCYLVAWVRYDDGLTQGFALVRLRLADFRHSVPWRQVRSRHGQPHCSGSYASVATGGFVSYESRLELARLLLADFDPQMEQIYAQPFRLAARVGGRVRHHVQRVYVVELRGTDTPARERGVSAPYLKNLARNWDLPIRRHGDFSGIGRLDLPAPPSPALRAVTMRTGALGRLEMITRMPGRDSLAAAARMLYGGRGGALQQIIAKAETSAGLRIIDRSAAPLSPADAGRELIREALEILRSAQEQMAALQAPGTGT
jgi:hypothetical protein